MFTKEKAIPDIQGFKMVQIKAQLEGKGHSLGESGKAELGHFEFPNLLILRMLGHSLLTYRLRYQNWL